MYSDTGNTTSLVLGFPIRTSSDPRSVGSSPRHIAASHVLHRLSVPRHPPCALKHLQHKTKKMSHHPHTTPHPPQKERHRHHVRVSEKFALHRTRRPTKIHALRCSQPLSTNQTPHPTTKAGRHQPLPPHTGAREQTGLLPQSPIVCLTVSTPHKSPYERANVCCCTRP